MKHASVTLGEFSVTLIGIPPEATEYSCDGCGKVFAVECLELNAAGTHFFCRKCGGVKPHSRITLSASADTGRLP
jgi:predicted RNA-binding Zn-ribbon protein involved in translation (DUF1610 family)